MSGETFVVIPFDMYVEKGKKGVYVLFGEHVQGLSAKSRPLLNAYNSKSIAHRNTCYNASESLANYLSNDINLGTVRQIIKKL